MMIASCGRLFGLLLTQAINPWILTGVTATLTGCTASTGCSLGAGNSLLQRADYIFHSLNETETAGLDDAEVTETVAASKTAETEICVPPCVDGCKMLRESSFLQQLADGTAAAAEKGLIMAGLMRNDGTGGDKLLSALGKVGKAFKRRHLVIIENDSTDNTNAVLKERCQGSDSWCFELTLPKMGEKQDVGISERIKHMTELRQMLLKQVRKYAEASPVVWDFLLMFDGDIFSTGNAGFHPGATLALLGFRSNPNEPLLADAPPDVVCSNGIMDWWKGGPGRFRDTFAFRQKSFEEALLVAGEEGGDVYFHGNKLVQVKSCFSGLALYKLPSLLASGCEYSYKDEQTCEHVTLHSCMSEKGYGNVNIYSPWTVRFGGDKSAAVTNACANAKTGEITQGTC